jgi:NADH-quinone oxidoreductase subunit E
MTYLTDAMVAHIRSVAGKYPNKQAATLPALHLIQDTHRCVPLAAIRELADVLDLSPAEIHDTMSFYNFFKPEDNPLGKYRIWICRGLACELRGCDELAAHFSAKLNMQAGATSPDKLYTLEMAECIGACDGAPALMVDDKHENDMTPAKIDELLTRLKH